MAAIGLSAAPASADALTYTFEPNTTVLLNGSLETISGSFVFGTRTWEFSSDDILLFGPSAYSAVYDEDVSD